jgi:hypothetical protein
MPNPTIDIRAIAGYIEIAIVVPPITLFFFICAAFMKLKRNCIQFHKKRAVGFVILTQFSLGVTVVKGIGLALKRFGDFTDLNTQYGPEKAAQFCIALGHITVGSYSIGKFLNMVYLLFRVLNVQNQETTRFYNLFRIFAIFLMCIFLVEAFVAAALIESSISPVGVCSSTYLTDAVQIFFVALSFTSSMVLTYLFILPLKKTLSPRLKSAGELNMKWGLRAIIFSSICMCLAIAGGIIRGDAEQALAPFGTLDLVIMSLYQVYTHRFAFRSPPDACCVIPWITNRKDGSSEGNHGSPKKHNKVIEMGSLKRSLTNFLINQDEMTENEESMFVKGGDQSRQGTVFSGTSGNKPFLSFGNGCSSESTAPSKLHLSDIPESVDHLEENLPALPSGSAILNAALLKASSKNADNSTESQASESGELLRK